MALLSVRRQCALLGLARSGVYRAKPTASQCVAGVGKVKLREDLPLVRFHVVNAVRSQKGSTVYSAEDFHRLFEIWNVS
jgi:hypothetical protein